MSFSMKASHPFARSGNEAVVENPSAKPSSSLFSKSYGSALTSTPNPSANSSTLHRASTTTQVVTGSDTGMAIRTVSEACPDYY